MSLKKNLSSKTECDCSRNIGVKAVNIAKLA